MDNTNASMYNMTTNANTYNVFSVMNYWMRHSPDDIIRLLAVYEGYMNPLIAWFTGFSYAMSLVEDNGQPLDLDEVLHNWQGDNPYDIQAAVERYLQEYRQRNGY